MHANDDDAEIDQVMYCDDYEDVLSGIRASLILEWRVPAKEVEEGNMARARGRHGEAMLLISSLNAG